MKLSEFLRNISRPLLLLFLLMVGVSASAQDSPVVRKITLQSDSLERFPLENLTYRSPKTLKVALVLSGGGARGFAHIGVLRALEENDIPIDLIVGSSIGSFIGGFYAAGYDVSTVTKIIHEINWPNLFNDEAYRTNLFWSQKSDPRRHILELRFDNGVPYIPSAISQGQRMFDIIYSRLLRATFQAANNFDNLRIPFRAVSTDLISGRRVVLKKGDLAEAISASSAIPLLFAPVELDHMWLADGGIRDNLPVDVAINDGANITIAVDVTSPLRTPDQMKSPWQLADQVTTIMMREPTRESRNLADILIQPQVGNHGASDFSSIDSLIDAGYLATLGKIDSIKKLIQIRQGSLWGSNDYLGKIDTVEVIGSDSVPSDTLIKGMQTQSGRSLYEYDIYHDLYRFYNSGLFGDAYVLLKGEPHAFRVEFHLKENPAVEGVEFESRHSLPDSLLENQFKISEHEILDYNLLFSGLDRVLDLYTKSGYSLARISMVKFDQSTHRLIIRIDEGYVEALQIQGNSVTQNSIILREFPLKKGEIFKADMAVQGIRNIYSTGLFDRVMLNVNRNPSGNRLIIKVKEKKYFLMRLGGNVSLERKGNAFMEFAEDNLFGREIKASLSGLIGDLERQAEFRVYSVRLFNTLLTYRLSLYYRDRQDRYYRDFKRLGEYLTIKRGVQFILGQQIERLGSITAELRWDHVNVYSNSELFPYRDRYRIRSITIRSTVDKRDKLPFPDKGIYNRWFWESGNQRILGGSTAFTRFYIGLEGYYPLFHHLNYHAKAEGGSADLTLPFSEFFTLGGMTDFPGLYENEKFGRQFLHFRNEVRQNLRPLFKPLDLYFGVTFDVGAVWETSEDPIRRSDFLTSWGSYIAVNSIFGPIRFAYGHLAGKRDLIYLSIGYRF